MAHIGHYISGAGHIALIGFVLVGPLFSSDPLPFESVNVAVISETEFAALTRQPQAVAPPDAPAIPDVPEDAAPALSPVVDTPREIPPPPEPPSAPPADSTLATPPSVPVPVVPPQTDAPSLAAPEAIEVPDAPTVSQRPRQRQSDRIAPTPVAPPAPDTSVAPDIQDAIAPVPDTAPTDRSLDAQEATAPQEAASEIVTEAEEGPPAAPERSPRPLPRPQQLAAAAPPDPGPRSVPEETDETADPDATAAAIADALEQALAEPDVASGTAAGAPSGPPLTAGEREGLVIAVQECWIIDPGSPAAEVVVTIALSLTREGRVQGDIRRVSALGGDGRAQDVAFAAARRAVLRCEAGGYPLPPEKYEQWQEVEITFNPESMRVR